MRALYLLWTAAILLMPMKMKSQTYEQLWKQVEQARQQDLPQTAIGRLAKIEKTALQKGDYGQLLKATLLHSKLQTEIAPDSLLPAVGRLEQQAAKAGDPVLKAVYATVLASIYKDQRRELDDWQARYDEYYRIATASPDLLAAVKADTYQPLVQKGTDSDIYGHDLLSLVGSELTAWQWLNDYYTRAGNRRAACMTALRLTQQQETALRKDGAARYIGKLDSLIALYGDLNEAGEIAIERYDAMGYHDAAYTRREKADWLQQARKRWSSWKRINVLSNYWQEMTCPSFDISSDCQVVMPDTEQELTVQIRNVTSLTMRIYKTTLDGETLLNPADDDDYRKIKGGLTELTDRRHTSTYQLDNEYDYKKEKIAIGGLPKGVYLLEFATDPGTHVRRQLYFVTGLRMMMLPMPEGKLRYVVVDAMTGKPARKAALKLKFDAGWRKPTTSTDLACDKNGEAVYLVKDNRQPSQVFAYTADDKYCPVANLYGRYIFYQRKYGTEHTNLFTDRSIYRPGQTVRVAAIVWKEQTALEQTAVEGKSLKLQLRDANYRVVAERQLHTDSYGKCSTEFTLPDGQLNGYFTISTTGASTNFRVEEYKRPTFQVTFDDCKEAYQQGDTVRATAKAATYAGAPVQGATVSYRVMRRVAWWWLAYSWYWERGAFGTGSNAELVAEGQTTTAGDGTFSIPMPMVMPYGEGSTPMFYHFVAEADVTDVGGETHSATISLPLGSKPTALTCNLPQKVRSDQLPQVTFERRNAAGQLIAGQVAYRIDKGKWKEASANEPLAVLSAKLSSGDHWLKAVCEQDTIDMQFTVFSLDDKKPVITEGEWFYVSDHRFPADGSPVTIQVGAVAPDLHIVYSVFADDKVIESGQTDRKNSELLVHRLSYKEEYGNGVLAVFSWVREGKGHSYETYIARPVPDRKLKMAWETFRDRLTPGQQEEWRLKVLKPDGSPAAASLMAVLYDKSLDQLARHQWQLAPSAYLPQPSTSWAMPYWPGIAVQASKDYKPLSIQPLRFTSFDHDVFPSSYYFNNVFAVGKAADRRMMMKSAVTSLGAAPNVSTMDVMGNDMAAPEAAEEAQLEAPQAEEDKQDMGGGQQEEQLQLRQNLAETAFCYPALQTDSTGVVTLRFTLPESLTTWRFMGVTNTADMLCGYIDGEAVAAKEVMVQPNVPRFVRMGDEAELTARVFNMSEKTVGGKVRMQLLDAANDELVMEQEMDFSADAGQTSTVTFRIDGAWLSEALLVCRVTASGEGFSDGEQHYLPILSNRELVTKTVPFTQHQPGVKSIDLTRLFPNDDATAANLVPLGSRKLTVEYTNNPAWLMVQALPVLGQPWEKSAIDQAACYYSNALAAHLMAQNPQAKSVFEQWKREQVQPSTLTAQLAKNQELKDLLLSETPWVADADRETEQRQRLADFFDTNTIGNRLATAVEQLTKLQNADGSFSWYPGMHPSTGVTMAVEEMLARLTVMTGRQKAVTQMQDKAFDYLANEMQQLVKEMKRQEKKGVRQSFPSFTALRWLYICAVDGRQLKPGVKTANDYLTALMKKDLKRQNIYEKALSAVILAKRGETKLAAQYVRSLKEYSVCTEEMGRYYDTRRAAYSWYDYKIPTEVAAIEALLTVTPKDRQTADEMRRWLLQQKRTQSWDTPISTVNAIYAFMAGNGTSLLAAKETATLAIDGRPLGTTAGSALDASAAGTPSAGLGYVKTTIGNPQGKTFTATKTSEGTSWGAVYAQFVQKTAEIEASQSGIALRREILVRDASSSHYAPLATPASPLAVGSRIKVRITIEAARDLDYVQVVDRRAACMEPVSQLSGYHHGAYCTPKDNATHYYYDRMAKGKHVIETEYYIDRGGRYETGTCTAGCAYAPEYRGLAPSLTITVEK